MLKGNLIKGIQFTFCLMLFKYLKKEHLLKFQKSGILRFGTLYDYRTIEGPIQDKSEGCITYYRNPTDQEVILNPEQASKLFFPKKLLQDMVIKPKARIRRENTVLNSFVFCTSLVYDKNLMKKWDYDSYFVITDAYQFAKLVFDELRTKYFPMQSYNLRKVSYVNTKEIFITNSNKAEVINCISNEPWEGFFTKPKEEFSDDREFRMVWVPEPDVSIRKVDLTIPKLRSCCKFY
jgi:hypothetical protein